MSAPSDFTVDLLKRFVTGRPLRPRQIAELVHSGYVTEHPDGTHTITTEGTTALNHFS